MVGMVGELLDVVVMTGQCFDSSTCVLLNSAGVPLLAVLVYSLELHDHIRAGGSVVTSLLCVFGFCCTAAVTLHFVTVLVLLV
jgi:hypothetical protein